MQKIAYHAHSAAIEWTQHALAVGMCAAGDLTKFIEDEEGSLDDDKRAREVSLREIHDVFIADFYSPDAINTVPRFPDEGEGFDEVRTRYADLIE